MTQAQIAEALGIRQASVAQMEKRSELMLSTLRSYVEAMGGELRLTVTFPGQREVELGGLGEGEGHSTLIPPDIHRTACGVACSFSSHGVCRWTWQRKRLLVWRQIHPAHVDRS